MSWFYEAPREVPTKHNGVMRLSRSLGRWSLKGHDGSEQATPYMDEMWTRAMRARAVADARPRRVLLLGVAMGGTVGVIARHFPEAEIIGVDWEPELLALGGVLGIFDPRARFTFIEGDARAVVPTLGGAFDLVVVDLFNGREVSGTVRDPDFQDAIAAATNPGGVVLVNGYFDHAVFGGWRERFIDAGPVRYQANTVVAFIKKMTAA